MDTAAKETQKVIIIDDSKSFRQYVEELLSGAGYQAFSAQDGSTGLELIENIQPDVVLLDIEMPVMDGREVLAALHPEGRLFSVVVLTSKSAMEDCLSVFNIGADDYIPKPFNDDELLARVRAAARTAQLKKELAASRDEALDLLHKYEISEEKLAEERELTAISKLISGIADKMNSPIGYVRSNIGTMMRYSDVLMELCERMTALQARRDWTADEIRQALDVELQWMEQSRIGRMRQYMGPLAKETVQGIDRIAAIIRKLLQIDIAGGHMEKKPENMVCLVNMLAGQIRERNSGITISVEAEEETVLVDCNKVRIVSALENVIENAVEALRGAGWILIRICKGGDSVIMDISDTGGGIPGKNLDAVFDPFVSGSPCQGKVGLGLTVAKYLINANRGSISITSDEGKGTRVRIELPVTASNAALHKEAALS